MIYQISRLHERLQEVETQLQQHQRQLGVVVEYVASRQPALARILGLTLTADDLN